MGRGSAAACRHKRPMSMPHPSHGAHRCDQRQKPADKHKKAKHGRHASRARGDICGQGCKGALYQLATLLTHVAQHVLSSWKACAARTLHLCGHSDTKSLRSQITLTQNHDTH
eukprot:359690-Chlamydomonas_euryale.AAC.4